MCGPGVERIYIELKNIFPDKKIEIFSSDALEKLLSPKEIIKKFERRKIDILVGTQLISKGYHFPKLNCIVVVDADFSSHGYDLRAAEKNIQLYNQLAGRAGREGGKSTIYFQTYTPNNEIFLNLLVYPALLIYFTVKPFKSILIFKVFFPIWHHIQYA